jgi:hypothetical protein
MEGKERKRTIRRSIRWALILPISEKIMPSTARSNYIGVTQVSFEDVLSYPCSTIIQEYHMVGILDGHCLHPVPLSHQFLCKDLEPILGEQEITVSPNNRYILPLDLLYQLLFHQEAARSTRYPRRELSSGFTTICAATLRFFSLFTISQIEALVGGRVAGEKRMMYCSQDVCLESQ